MDTSNGWQGRYGAARRLAVLLCRTILLLLGCELIALNPWRPVFAFSLTMFRIAMILALLFCGLQLFVWFADYFAPQRANVLVVARRLWWVVMFIGYAFALFLLSNII